MKAICVDDERIQVENVAEICMELPEIDEVKSFVRAKDVLPWIKTNPVDLALLDIDMPEIDGITLAAKIKQASPKTVIMFLTAYKKFAYDAFSVHPAGYLLKPISQEILADEVAYAFAERKNTATDHVRIKTFGYFDVYVDGKLISFKLAKAKEILAYLVDKQGSGVTRAELFAAVWEDRLYDRKMQKQLDTYIRSLRDTLKEYGISEIMEMERGVLHVKPETFICDAYLFYAGDTEAINSYRGEYMSAYSWASNTEGILSWKAENP